MAGTRYFGRSDKTKYQMGDAEVVSLHARRRNTEADTLALLRKEMDEDPLRDVGAQSHLFLVAQPAAGPRDMCLSITGAQYWNMRLHTLIHRVHENQSPPPALGGKGFSPESELRAPRTQARQGSGSQLLKP
ncbi:hypothetical protein [Streptomyces iranensis]|uniref:Uncharacterized protein n=1 Tax=Streptomyces iranensis TaxID=576784 RepID=A0A060ZBP7_9ACTN|nr:hypothetical protein [Streptomyces iranensis]MBP2068530.1 hypothetical protein [Streptomyces iranensis]CDR01247.1 predicted protein [Streptomyces iranensis]